MIIKTSLDYLKQHYRQLGKFITVGLTTCAIYFLTFHFFYDVLHLDYRVAASFSYAITIALHFLLHRLVTFTASSQKITRNIKNYICMLGINYANMLLIVWFVVNITKLSPYFGLLTSTAVSAFLSFFIMKYFVFKP